MSDFRQMVDTWEPGPFDPDVYERWADDVAAWNRPPAAPEPTDEPSVDPLLP